MPLQIPPLFGQAAAVRPEGEQVPGTPVPDGQVPAAPQFFGPVPIAQDRFTPLGFMAATLTIASAATIGSNMVDVRNGTMTKTRAVANGLAKGAAASVVLSLTPKQTVLDIALTAAALAGTGYAIDKMMKRTKDEICQVQTEPV